MSVTKNGKLSSTPNIIFYLEIPAVKKLKLICLMIKFNGLEKTVYQVAFRILWNNVNETIDEHEHWI